MSARWQIWDAEIEADRQAWADLWQSSPMQEPFAHPAVCSLLSPADGRLLAATMAVGEGHVLYPFFLRGVDRPTTDASSVEDMTDGHLTDIISPYGYGGPMHWGLDDVEDAATVFWSKFDAWAHEHGVISEFVRFSLFSESLLPYSGSGRTRSRQTNYVRDLRVSAADLTQQVAPKVRSNVRRALREGVTTVIDTEGEHLDDFLRIYIETMERLDSASWYRFERSFFERLHVALPGRFAYVFAKYDGRLVSADLLICGSDTGYYFLGGTEASAYPVRPNDLVKTAAMKWLQDNGCRHYVLGGGVTAEDGLERYKKGFAPHGGVAFRTGERVLSGQGYEALVADRRRQFSDRGLEWHDSDEFFPAYRRDCAPAAVPQTERTRS